MKDKSDVLEESPHDEIQRLRHIDQCVVKCHNPLEKLVVIMTPLKENAMVLTS